MRSESLESNKSDGALESRASLHMPPEGYAALQRYARPSRGKTSLRGRFIPPLWRDAHPLEAFYSYGGSEIWPKQSTLGGSRMAACVVAHVAGIPMSFAKENVRKVGKLLSDEFPTNNLKEATWCIGCVVDKDGNRGALSVTQITFTNALQKRFEVKRYSEIPASVSIARDRQRLGHIAESSSIP